MSKETEMFNEWQKLIEEYGLDELRRWFVSFTGYKAVRADTDYESLKLTLKRLVI